MASDRDTLPKSLHPSHYVISLTDIAMGAPWTYQGRVRIDAQIHEMTDHITLNSHQLKIGDVSIFTEQSATEKAIKSKDISYNEKAQQVTFSFDGTLPTSPRAIIDIEFEGTVNNVMAGFYRSKYKPAVPAVASVPKDEEHHYMFSTQFESCDARRAFPCFDEPNLKATFDFEIEIPEDQLALSNMPEKATKPGSKPGLKVVSFDRTPVMSTYLLAWAFGDFEYVEDFTRRKYNGNSLPVRVYTTRGLKEQGRFALEHAHQVVDYFSEIFGIDYPLPKADLLAVHEFSHGAMENWGLVTYRTTAVLFDEATSDQRYKRRVAYVVAHELAHQWFGNLVTMDWWSELWLNESFATWVGWLAIDHLHPEWNVWAQFVADEMQAAYKLDSLRSSHPIEVPVRDALEVDQIFDAISYRKGCSILRMLAAHLTPNTFIHGVSNYLKAHAYGNATTNDLWKSLSEASGQDVNALMDPWIREIGFPVVTVAEEPGQIGVRQSRFLSSGDAKPEEDKTTWWVPLELVNGLHSKDAVKQALTTKEETLRSIDDVFYKLNKDQTGFYRTNYPPARLAKLGAAADRLSVQDKIGLISDATALAKSGEGATPAVLQLLEGFQGETDYNVWSQITSSLASIRSIFSSNKQLSDALKNYTLKLVTPAAERLEWDYKPDEDYLTSQLRSLLIAVAGLAGHRAIIDSAHARFNAYISPSPSSPTSSAIHPNLLSAVFRIAMTHSPNPAATFSALQQIQQSTPSPSIAETALAALGRTQDPRLADELVSYLLSDRVPLQDKHTPASALASNAAARATLWQGIQTHWAVIAEKMGGNSVVLDRFVRVSLGSFADKAVEEEIGRFFEGKDCRGFDRGVAVVREGILGNDGWRGRDEGVVAEWLGVNGY